MKALAIALLLLGFAYDHHRISKLESELTKRDDADRKEMPITSGGMRVIDGDGNQYVTVITPWHGQPWYATVNMGGKP